MCLFARNINLAREHFGWRSSGHADDWWPCMADGLTPVGGDMHAIRPAPPPLTDVISIDRSNEILQALQRLTPEQVGPVAPQIVTVAAEVQRVLHEVHAQADALRGALTNLALEHDRWTTDPQTFLQHLVGDRTDVFVRQDYKPFYTMEPSGRRKFWAAIPP